MSFFSSLALKMESSNPEFSNSNAKPNVPTAVLLQELSSLKTQEEALSQILKKCNVYLTRLKVSKLLVRNMFTVFVNFHSGGRNALESNVERRKFVDSVAAFRNG